ncbi:MAG: SMC-Scp complex subunit ScpB [Polyangiales bacterium]
MTEARTTEAWPTDTALQEPQTRPEASLDAVTDHTDEQTVPAPRGPALEKAQPSAAHLAHLRSILESLIFAADKAISPRRLAQLSGAPYGEVQAVLSELVAQYKGRGIVLVQVGGGYQFRTPPANAPFVRDVGGTKPVRLSRAQLETLAIVAYRQPVTRPEIDEVRGVDSGNALKILGERDLVRVLGRKEEPGRPLLYGTSAYFLDFFGLQNLRELPTLQEFSELSDESKTLFQRRIGEPFDLHAAPPPVVEEAEAAEGTSQLPLRPVHPATPQTDADAAAGLQVPRHSEIRALRPKEEDGSSRR